MLLLAIKISNLFNLNESKLQIKFSDNNISDDNINKLITGLFYPDLPCSYFYIKEKKIEIELRLCSIVQLTTLGKNIETAIKSQMEDSHNGRFSINHSMSYDNNLNREYIRDLIVARCIIMLYSFFETKNFAFLGFLIHIIQDSYSQSHTSRNNYNLHTQKKTIIYNKSQVKEKLESANFIRDSIDLQNIIINYDNINKLLYYVLDNDNNRKLLLQSINSISTDNIDNVDITSFINIIIKLLLSLFDNNNNKKLELIHILFGWNHFLHKTIFSNISTDEKISDKNVNNNILKKESNKLIIDINKISSNQSNILQNIKYENLSHSLRRLYKLTTNYLYNDNIIERIYSQNGGGVYSQNNINTKRYYIDSFLYYPLQNKEKHKTKDCGYVLIKKNPYFFIQTVIDTKTILELCLTEFYKYNINPTKENAKESITKIYNYLINNTFYLKDLKETNNDSNDSSNFFDINKCMLKSVISNTPNYTIKKILNDIKTTNTDYSLDQKIINDITSEINLYLTTAATVTSTAPVVTATKSTTAPTVSKSTASVTGTTTASVTGTTTALVLEQTKYKQKYEKYKQKYLMYKIKYNL
jgi:hypothetical protein